MAYHKFLSAIRATRGAVLGRTAEADAAAAAATADVWLTPDLVKDYVPADFGFLTPDEQRDLDDAVSAFRRLTTGLHDPTPEAVAEGAGLFRRINAILDPHIDEPDLQRIAAATRSIPWPDFVLWTDSWLATDWTGDPVVWTRLVIRDDVELESAAVQDELAEVQGAYREAIQREGIDRLSYTTVRTRSEAKELVGGAA